MLNIALEILFNLGCKLYALYALSLTFSVKDTKLFQNGAA